MNKLHFLLTNDDGYLSPNLIALREVLKDFGEVTTVAPLEEKSGASTSLTLFKDMKVIKVDDRVFAVDGTPADCVSFACSEVSEIKDIDIVISGPNNGNNITYDILHSGTCGACIEALIFKKPAIAFSFPYKQEVNKKWIKDSLNYIFDNFLVSNEYFLNVNFPRGNNNFGHKIGSVGVWREKRFFVNQNNDGFRSSRVTFPLENQDKDCDIYLVEHGYTCITPLMPSFFSSYLLKKIKKMVK